MRSSVGIANRWPRLEVALPSKTVVKGGFLAAG